MGLDAEKLLNKLLLSVGLYTPKVPPPKDKPDAVDFNLNWFAGPLSETKRTLRSKGGQDAIEGFFTELTKGANTPEGKKAPEPARLELGTTAFTLWKFHEKVGGIRLFGRRTWSLKAGSSERENERLLLGVMAGAEAGPVRAGGHAGILELGAPDPAFPVGLPANKDDQLWFSLTVFDKQDKDSDPPKFPLKEATVRWSLASPTRPMADLYSFKTTINGAAAQESLALPDARASVDWKIKHVADLLGFFLRNWVRYAADKEARKTPPAPGLATRLRDHALPLLGYYAPEVRKPTPASEAIVALDVEALLAGPGPALQAWAKSWVEGATPWPPKPPPRMVGGLIHVMALTGLFDKAGDGKAARNSLAVWGTKTDPANPSRPVVGLVVDWDTSKTSLTPAAGGGVAYTEVGWLTLGAGLKCKADLSGIDPTWRLDVVARAGARLDYDASASGSARVGLKASAAWGLMLALESPPGAPLLSVTVAGTTWKIDRISLGFEGHGTALRPALRVYGLDVAKLAGLAAEAQATAQGALLDLDGVRDAALAELRRLVDAQIAALAAANPEIVALGKLIALVAQDPGAWLSAQAAALVAQARAWLDELVRLGVAELSNLLKVPSPLPSGASWAYDLNLNVHADLDGVGLSGAGAVSLRGVAETATASAAMSVSASAGFGLDLGLPVAVGAVQPGFTLAVDAGLDARAAGSTGGLAAAVSANVGARLGFWTKEGGARAEALSARLGTDGAFAWTIAGAAANTAPDLKALARHTVLPAARAVLQSELASSAYAREIATILSLGQGFLSGGAPDLQKIGDDLWKFAVSVIPTGTTLPAGLTLDASSGALTLPDLSVTVGSGPQVTAGVRGLGVARLFSAPTPAFSGADAGFYLEASGAEGRPLFDAGVGIGSVKASLVPFGAGAPSGSFAFKNVRLPFGQGGSGVEGGLLPKDGANPGFDVELDWSSAGVTAVRFRGKAGPVRLPVGLDIGPLSVRALLLDFGRCKKRNDSDPDRDGLIIDLDLGLSLGGLEIVPIGLGVDVPLEFLGEPEQWIFGLDGLGIGYDNGAVRIAGLLYKKGDDFRGAASLKFGTFELGAIAGFTMMDVPGGGKEPSFFAFVYVPVPLGGPPFFFVMGIAGGVGVNRALPAINKPADVAKHAFMVAMGKASILDAAAALDGLAPQRGTFWLAVGVKFVSFGFINGEAVLYVKLQPDRFELRLLAMARMAVAELVSIELALDGGLIIDDDPTFFVKAELTDNSYLLSKDCKLTGGFAFQVWPKRGDAVLTLGGYHPRFPVPAHYPKVPRLGFRWAVTSTVVIKGEAYFALTPRAIMAGGRLEARGEWGPIAAWLEAWLDACVSWDPFYFDVGFGVRIGVSLDTGLFGRLTLSVGAQIELHGPPVYGFAELEVCGMSFRLPIGDETPPPKIRPTLSEFLRKQLKLEAQQDAGGELILPLLFKRDGKDERLIAIEVERGLLRPGGADGVDMASPNASADKNRQPDTVRGPVDLLPEFTLAIRSPLPVTHGTYREEFPGAPPQIALNANPLAGAAAFYVEPSDLAVASSTIRLRMITPSAVTATDLLRPNVELLPTTNVPWSLWGAPSPTGNRAPPSGDSTVALHPGVRLDARAQLGAGTLLETTRDYSTDHGWSYALPLALSEVRDEHHPVSYAGELSTGEPLSLAELSQKDPNLASRLARQGVRKVGLAEPLARLHRPSRAASELVLTRAATAKAAAKLSPVARRAAAAPTATRLAAHRVTGALGLENTGLRSTVDGWASAARVAPPGRAVRSSSVAALELSRRLPTPTLRPAAAKLAAAPSVSRIKAAHAGALASRAALGWSRLSAPARAPGRGALDLVAGDTLQVEVDATPTLQVLSSGDQPVRVVALDEAGWPLLDGLASGPMALPRGAASVLVQGYGRDRAGAAAVPGEGGFVADSALVPARGGTLIGPRCVVRARGLDALTVGEPRRAGPLLAAAREVNVWLPPVHGALVVVLDDASTAAAGGLDLRSRDVALGEPHAVFAGRRVALVYGVSASRIWRLDALTLGPVGLSAVRTVDAAVASVLTRLEAGWSWLAPAPARPFGASRVQIARRSDV